MEMRAVYTETMAQLMREDQHVCILDADLSRACGTLGLYKEFPRQMFNCGIAEQNMAGVAAGLASYGYKPWIESFTAFVTRRICDQVAISIAYAGMNVKIVGTDPGFAAELNGGTHMSMEDIAVLRSIPGMVIFEPADPVQLRAALPIINEYQGCVYIRLYRKELPALFGPDYAFDLFGADLIREGTDLTMLVSGCLTHDALEAAALLEARGISCELINVHTVKPLDGKTIRASAHKTGAVLTVENHNIIGGLHSAVLELLARDRIPVSAVGVRDRFGEVGKAPHLKEVLGLRAQDIAAMAREAVQLK